MFHDDSDSLLTEQLVNPLSLHLTISQFLGASFQLLERTKEAARGSSLTFGTVKRGETTCLCELVEVTLENHTHDFVYFNLTYNNVFAKKTFSVILSYLIFVFGSRLAFGDLSSANESVL